MVSSWSESQMARELLGDNNLALERADGLRARTGESAAGGDAVDLGVFLQHIVNAQLVPSRLARVVTRLSRPAGVSRGGEAALLGLEMRPLWDSLDLLPHELLELVR